MNTSTYREVRNSKEKIMMENAIKTADKGNMYVIVDRSKAGICNVLSIDANSNAKKYFNVLETELPKYAMIDDVMRFKNGEYVPDKELTNLSYYGEFDFDSYKE